MEYRRFGRTEYDASIAILGGAACTSATPEQGQAFIELATSHGVNRLDIAPSYGVAEDAIGPCLPEFREQLFVGCKTRRKNPDGVRAQMAESLGKLRLEQFDLYQAHAVTDIAVLDERAQAFEVMLKARDEGLTRFVGITGHDLGAPAAHLEALARYDLDTVMFPIYPRAMADFGYMQDVFALLVECAQRDVGVQVIKAIASRPWGEREVTHSTWYEPQTTADAIQDGVDFAMSTPGIHGFCTPGDLSLLPMVLDAAENFTEMSDEEVAMTVADMSGEEIIFPLLEKARRQP